MTDQELFAREHAFAKELSQVELQIANLKNRELELNQLLNKCQSKRWIKANNVTLDDIQISNKGLANSIARKIPKDIPFFIDVFQFGKWMKDNEVQTRFFEWNKHLYHRLEFFEANRLPSGYAAKIEDVPGYVEI